MRILNLFLRQGGYVDDISNCPSSQAGASVAAGWSWGLSFIGSISIMHSKGFIPFAIWAIGNILAIPLMNLVRKFLPQSKNWPRFLPILLMFLMVEIFAILINLQSMLTGLGGGKDVKSYEFCSKEVAIVLTVIYGLLIVVYVMKWGLRLVMLTDLGSYVLQMGSAVFIAIIAVLSSDNKIQVEMMVPDNTEWTVYAFLGIITGALAHGHLWQKFTSIKEVNTARVTAWSTLFFGVYMVVVAIASIFFNKETMVLGLSFLLLMIALSTSTIDSCVSGIGFILRKLGLRNVYLPFIFSMAIIVGWGLWLNDKGVTELWSMMANIRWPIMICFILATAVAPVTPEWIRSCLGWLRASLRDQETVT